VTVRPEIPFQVITPDDVRASVRRAKKSLEKAAEEVVWQVEHEAWVTLGYSSWNAMREAEYGEAAFMVPRKDRPELVGRMRAAGLPNREIARTAGVDEGTVRNDLRRTGAENSAPVDLPKFADHMASYRASDEPKSSGEGAAVTTPARDNEPVRVNRDTGEVLDTPDATTGPAPASADPEPVTTTCPTCKGTGKVTR
jgi:hypothetical protein